MDRRRVAVLALGLLALGAVAARVVIRPGGGGRALEPERAASALVRVAPPGGEVAIHVPADFGPMPTMLRERVASAARIADPGAYPLVYGRMAEDGSLGMVMVLRQRLDPDADDGRSLRDEVASLEDWLASEHEAIQTYVYGQDLDFAFAEQAEERAVDFAGALRFDDLELWLGGRMSMTQRGTLETLLCACSGRGCATVRERCAFESPSDALAIDAPWKAPPLRLAADGVFAELPHGYTLDDGLMTRVASEEVAGYPGLWALEGQAAVAPGAGTAFVQRGTWCEGVEGCDLAAAVDAVEASARAHASGDGLAIEVRRSLDGAGDGAGLEIELGERSWERRWFSVEDGAVVERSCLCSWDACAHLERSCSLPAVD